MANRKTTLWVALCFVAIVTAVIIHAALWLLTADIIRQEIRAFYDDAAASGIVIEGPFPVIGGYPLTHEVLFSGRVSDGTHTLELPHLQASGLFLPGRMIRITMESGLALRGGGYDPELWSLSQLHIEGTIPQTLPRDFTIEGLRAWRDEGGALDIAVITLNKRNMALTGNSLITLDETLQPAGQINAVITGDYVDFLSFLRQKGAVRTRESLVIGAVMAGMMQDGEIRAQINVQNRNLFLGPLLVAELPAIQWPWRNAPDQSQ